MPVISPAEMLWLRRLKNNPVLADWNEKSQTGFRCPWCKRKTQRLRVYSQHLQSCNSRKQFQQDLLKQKRQHNLRQISSSGPGKQALISV